MLYIYIASLLFLANQSLSGLVLRHLHLGALTPVAIVVVIVPLLAVDALHLLAADEVTTHLVGTTGGIEIMTDGTGIGIGSASANANVTDLAALTIVTEISKMIVIDMTTETAVMKIATTAQMATIERVRAFTAILPRDLFPMLTCAKPWTRYPQATMSLTQPSNLVRGAVVVVR